MVSRATLEIVLQAKDDASRTMAVATKMLGNLGGVAGTVTAAGLAAAAAGAAAVGAAVVVVSKEVYQFSRETDEAMRLFQAQVGASSEEMAGFKEEAIDVFEAGWADSIGEISGAMATVNQVLGEQGDLLEASTRRALVLSEVFGVDVREGVSIAAAAVKSDLVGSSEEAFDLITRGFQMGLDQAGDFGDTIREYASDFQRLGYTGDEVLSLLNAGLEAGAYNTDVIADGLREFNIRLQEGGDAARGALNDLFEGLMGDAEAAQELRIQIDDTTAMIEAQEQALKDNSAALEEAEGLYAASADQVAELEDKLNEAKRQLQDLAAPKLEGMDEIDDSIFDTQMAIKEAKLALLDLPEGTDEYEDVEGRIGELNTQLDKLQLTRDIQFERQLREIEEAAAAGTEEAMSYEDAMQAIADKKDEIADLSGELETARGVMQDNRMTVEDLKANHDLLSGAIDAGKVSLEGLEGQLENVTTPADAFLQGLSEGSITGKDALRQVTDQLLQIEDPLERNRLGTELFGTKWEDIGPQVFIAAGQARDAVEGVAGATDRAGQVMQEGLGNAVERLKRTVVANLSPLGDIVVETMNKAAPYLDKATAWLGEKIPQALEWLDEKWSEIFPNAEGAVAEFWAGIKPAILWVEYYFNQFTDGILPHLERAWGSLKVGWDLIKLVVERDLMPALKDLFDALGIGGDDVGELSEKFGDFVGFLIDVGVKVLILGIASAIERVANWARDAKGFIDDFKKGLNGVKDAAYWVRDQIDKLKGTFQNLTIPDWLTPGSPTPFELGLRGIADAVKDLPDMESQFSVNGSGAGGRAGAASALLGAGGGGGTYVIHNHFGVGSVRNDDDIEEIARRQEEILAVRGVRSWGV